MVRLRELKGVLRLEMKLLRFLEYFFMCVSRRKHVKK